MLENLGVSTNNFILSLVTLEHRVDPLFRDLVNRLFQRPLTNLVQALLSFSHSNPETSLCQEIPVSGEEEIVRGITQQMERFTEREYKGKIAERAGNTKTYGMVEAEFSIRDDIPEPFRRGLFASPQTFRAWIRFSGPGPLSPPDVSDAGILSIGVKLLGVPGDKFLPDENDTQDFLGISCPTFTTPNIVENLKLQKAIYARTPIFYFLNPLDSHYLDAIMQGLYARMNTSPLEVRYWSCTPYLLGEGTAMKYSFAPRPDSKTRIPWNLPDNWLRQALTNTLRGRDWEFDFLIQRQTDHRRMPIEDASIEWSEKASPFVPVATIRIPMQTVDTPERTVLARKLAFNPWHSIAEHRPLGNQNRARRQIYSRLASLRQSMNEAISNKQ